MSPAVDPLVVEGMSVALDGRLVLHDVDLQVGPGEFVVLLGSNGSGKSTLVRAAVGLVPIIGGSVRLFGTPLAGFDEHTRLGYVPQRTSAAAGVPATVQEVVMSGRLARRRLFRRRTAADRSVVDEAIDRVGLGDRRASSVNELSGGQQQRVLIARALATEADLLVMDEPTAGVDHDQQITLASVLGDLVAAGTSVLLVAHELGPMQPLIDRAVVLDVGRVVHDGPVDDHTSSHLHSHQHTGAPPRTTVSGDGVWP